MGIVVNTINTSPTSINNNYQIPIITCKTLRIMTRMNIYELNFTKNNSNTSLTIVLFNYLNQIPTTPKSQFGNSAPLIILLNHLLNTRTNKKPIDVIIKLNN